MVFWVDNCVRQLDDAVEWEWGNAGIVCRANGYVFVDRNYFERSFPWMG